MIPACLTFLPYKLLWCDLRVPAAVCAVSTDDLGRGVPPPGRALQYSTVYERTVQYSTVQYMIVQYSTATLHLSELLTFPRTSRTNLL